jgi:hypothetical protein
MTDLAMTLRQILAVLETERQALAGLDLELILGCAAEKRELCDAADALASDALDEEVRGLIDAARRRNEINRQLRNLVAANVAKRLDSLTGTVPLYAAQTPLAAGLHC